jgi:hypothetical protein
MAGPAVFFVPLALAGGKVFFKFASRKAAEVFKKRFAKAGSVTTRTPPKTANVTTTSSSKGRSIVQDLTKPVTQPRVSPRNPNTSTLPKAPKSRSGGKAAGAAAAAGAGVAAGFTATGKDADKPKTAQGGGSVLSQRKADKIASDDTKIVLKKDKPAKKSMTLPTPPPKRPKKNKQVTPPKSKPKLYATISPLTGKPVDKKVTAAQHLANIDKFKARKNALVDIEANLKKASQKKKRK